jgi:cytochrome b561
MTRYHPILVLLHWVMALMIIMALMAGKFMLSPIAMDDPTKVEAAAGHMTIGLIVSALLIIRLLIRFFSTTPPHAKTGNAILDRIGALTHWVLYALVFGLVASGLAFSVGGEFIGLVAGAPIEFLPADLTEWAPRKAHGLFGTLLLLLVVLHIAAALYHQFFLRDGLFSRMWFGRRKP